MSIDSIRIARETEPAQKFDSQTTQGWKKVLPDDAKRYSLIFTVSSDTGGTWALSEDEPTVNPIVSTSFQVTEHFNLDKDGTIITLPLWLYDGGAGGKTEINVMSTRLVSQ